HRPAVGRYSHGTSRHCPYKYKHCRMITFLTTQPWPVYLVLFILCARLNALTLKPVPVNIQPSVFSLLTTSITLAIYGFGWVLLDKDAQTLGQFVSQPLAWFALGAGFCMALYDVAGILMHRVGAPFGISYALIRMLTIVTSS